MESKYYWGVCIEPGATVNLVKDKRYVLKPNGKYYYTFKRLGVGYMGCYQPTHFKVESELSEEETATHLARSKEEHTKFLKRNKEANERAKVFRKRAIPTEEEQPQAKAKKAKPKAKSKQKTLF